MATAIGATCEVKYRDDNDPDSFAVWYISFSQWQDDATHDAHGVHDDGIAFYCDDEEALKRLMSAESGEDFIVDSYELAYQ